MVHISLFLVFSLFVIVIVHVAESFAEFMQKQACHRKLEENQYIMGHKVISSTERLVTVSRNGEQLKSGDSYIPGETLEIDLTIIKAKGDHLFQSSSKIASFEGGGCNGMRLAKNSFSRKPKGNLTISANISDTSESIFIIAGWSSGVEAVKLSPAFILSPPVSNSNHGDGDL
jgi:hypothetical protein